MQSSCPLKKEREKRQKDRAAAKEQANVTPKIEEIASEKEMSFMVKHYYQELASEWVLDSGATSHMCSNRKAFESLKRLPKEKKVYLGDGSEVGAYGVGTVRLNSETVLEEVLYVPDFTVNLCSVSALLKEGYKVLFEDSGCIISKDGQEAICGTGTGLYTL